MRPGCMNTPGTGKPAPSDVHDAERTWGRLWAAVEALDPEVRTVFLLHGLTGARHDEIARLIGMPESVCATRLELARSRVFEAFAGSAHENR